jgi:hypothetical protein|tara:strand:+ start:651 stop:851 length:201 start_codon:yes stop_codon:yes gene_type:complete
MEISEKIADLQEKIGVVAQEIQKMDAIAQEQGNTRQQLVQEALRLDGAIRELSTLVTEVPITTKTK